MDLFYQDRLSAPGQPLLLGHALPWDYGEVFTPGGCLGGGSGSARERSCGLLDMLHVCCEHCGRRQECAAIELQPSTAAPCCHLFAAAGTSMEMAGDQASAYSSRSDLGGAAEVGAGETRGERGLRRYIGCPPGTGWLCNLLCTAQPACTCMSCHYCAEPCLALLPTHTRLFGHVQSQEESLVLDYKLVLMNKQEEVMVGLAHVPNRRYSSAIQIKTVGEWRRVGKRGGRGGERARMVCGAAGTSEGALAAHAHRICTTPAGLPANPTHLTSHSLPSRRQQEQRGAAWASGRSAA